MKICHIPHVIFQITSQFFFSNFAPLFSVMKDNSSVLFEVKRYILCTKGTNQSKNFDNFVCSDQNSPNPCHFWNNKSVVLQILSHSSVSRDITPLYFFSSNFIYTFNKRSLSKYRFGEISHEQSKVEILHFDGFHLSKSYKVSAKKIKNSYLSWHWRVMQSLKKNRLVVSNTTWRIW